jgi:drug/metabolite transporter (DMT)-like permease
MLPTRRADWIALAVMGITNTALPFVLISWGELTVDSAVASVLTGAVPLFVLILAHFFLDDERITLPRVAGLLFGFAGVLVLAARESTPGQAGRGAVSPGINFGVVALVLAVMSYAVSAIWARRKLRGISPLVSAFVPLVVADGATWIGTVAVELPIQLPQLPLTWLAVLWLGLLGSCAAYLVFFYLLENVGATRTALVAYLIALIGVALGVIFLGELLDWRLALGAALILGGIAVVSRFPAGKTVPAQPT